MHICAWRKASPGVPGAFELAFSRCQQPLNETKGSFRQAPCCVMLSRMGNKDKGKKETKKAPKPKPKPEPGRKREVFTPAPTK